VWQLVGDSLYIYKQTRCPAHCLEHRQACGIITMNENDLKVACGGPSLTIAGQQLLYASSHTGCEPSVCQAQI
jgi:hypothetical protein